MKVRFKKLKEDAHIPVYSTNGAAGADLYSVSEVVIEPGKMEYIYTGLAIEIPEGYVGIVTPRSSICLKKHLDMPNSVAVFDSDYRGEYIIAYRNLGDEVCFIEKGERCAQLLVIPVIKAEFEESQNLSETERGIGGYGSTGKK